MKLQISILVIGIALGAGSVSAELHRSASVAPVNQTVAKTIVSSQHSLKQSSTTQSSIKQSVTTPPKTPVMRVRPSIQGGSSDD